MNWGTLIGLECACGCNRTFYVKENCIVCSNCDRERECNPPIIGIVTETCECRPDVTFVIDSDEVYICTHCGHRRQK